MARDRKLTPKVRPEGEPPTLEDTAAFLEERFGTGPAPVDPAVEAFSFPLDPLDDLAGARAAVARGIPERSSPPVRSAARLVEKLRSRNR